MRPSLSAPESHRILLPGADAQGGSRALPPVGNLTLPRRPVQRTMSPFAAGAQRRPAARTSGCSLMGTLERPGRPVGWRKFSSMPGRGSQRRAAGDRVSPDESAA